MTKNNNNKLETSQVAGDSLSMPNLENNRLTEIMTSTIKDLETGQELKKSKMYYDRKEDKTVTLTTERKQYNNSITNLINPFSVGFSEPIKYGDYLKIEEGDNIIRVLTPAIFGVEWWTEEIDKESGKIKRKPNRLPLELALSDCPVLDWSYFNACYVWNYKANKVQILSTTKRGIINGIKNLINKPKWGDVLDYDLNITKTLKNPNDPKSAEYTVTPEPKATIEKEIIEKWQLSKQQYEYLTLLYAGLDPFEKVRAGEDLTNLVSSYTSNQSLINA